MTERLTGIHAINTNPDAGWEATGQPTGAGDRDARRHRRPPPPPRPPPTEDTEAVEVHLSAAAGGTGNADGADHEADRPALTTLAGSGTRQRILTPRDVERLRHLIGGKPQ